jgi:hypothetical protein
MAGLPNTGGGKFLENFPRDDDLDRRRPAGLAKGVDPQRRPSSRGHVSSSRVEFCQAMSSDVKDSFGRNVCYQWLTMRQGQSSRLVKFSPLPASSSGGGARGEARRRAQSWGEALQGACDGGKQNENISTNFAFPKELVAGQQGRSAAARGPPSPQVCEFELGVDQAGAGIRGQIVAGAGPRA